MGKMSRDKGKRGERMLSKELTEAGFPALRGVQFKGGPDSPDVICESLPIHWEVKFVERLHVRKALEQAIEESAWSIPVVAHKVSRQPWVVFLELDDFLNILKKAYGGSDECEREAEEPAGQGVRRDDDGGADGAASTESSGGGAGEADQDPR